MEVKKAKTTIKKVASKLKKASQAHAGQAKALSAVKLKKGGSPTPKNKSLYATVKAEAKRKLSLIANLEPKW